MSEGKISSRFYGTKRFNCVVIALALLTGIAAFGAVGPQSVFVDGASSLFAGPLSPVSTENPSDLSLSAIPLDVSVSLPNVSSTPGVILVPITVSDLTSLEIFSFDLQVTYNPLVLAPASPAYITPGTLSSAMGINPNTDNVGHLIIGAFQGSPLDGSGILIFLRFNVIGTPGQVSALTFENYMDPNSAPHPGFRFNEGIPGALTTNGSVTVAGSTPTNTATNTPTATATRTPTNTATATATSTATATGSPTPTPPCTNSASIPNTSAVTGGPVNVPVNISNMTGLGAVSASFTVTFNPGIITPNGVTFGPIGNSNGGGRALSYSYPTSSTINVSIFGGNEFQGSGTLVNLNFNVTGFPGTISPVDLTSFQYNAGSPCAVVTSGSFTVAAGTIWGTVTYGNVMSPPFPRPVPNVTINGAGFPAVSTVTDSSGAYTLSGFGSGTYTMNPSKLGGGNTSISGFDAAMIAQYVVNLAVFSPAQLAVANVSGSGGVSSFDASLVALYAVSIPPPTGSTGVWIFSPVSNTHTAIFSNINENYLALLMGDVSGNWGSAGSRPANAGGPERSSAVKAPRLVTPADSEVLIPIAIQGAANKGIISYEFDLRYDPAVIQPQANPVELTGTVSRGLSAVTNAEEPGLLKVTVYGPMPIEANGVLLNLKFTAVGAPGSVSPLVWERLMLNEGDPRAVSADGQVEISAAASGDAEISGKVLTAFGAGVPNARVTLTDTTGRSRTIVSNGFGAYRAGGLQVGQTYTIRVNSKQYTFTPLTVSVTGQLANVDLIAGQ